MSKLQENLYDQYRLVLIGSEIDDILALARQEIPLIEECDISDLAAEYIETNGCYGNLFDCFKDGVRMGLGKVRSPFPRSMRFTQGPDEFFKK